jgi:hypothetical protein
MVGPPGGPTGYSPLYHPSPANGGCWRRNKLYLRRLLTARSDPALRLLTQGREGTQPGPVALGPRGPALHAERRS